MTNQNEPNDVMAAALKNLKPKTPKQHIGELKTKNKWTRIGLDDFTNLMITVTISILYPTNALYSDLIVLENVHNLC